MLARMERSNSTQLSDDFQQNKSNLSLLAGSHASNFVVLCSAVKQSIMDHLEQISSHLFSKATTKDWRKKALKNNNDLLQQLINLPCKENETSAIPRKRMKSAYARIREPTGISVFDLDFELRLKLIGKLLDLQRQLGTGLDSVPDKRQLTEENNQIIHRLADLPRRIVEETEDDLKQSADDQERRNSTDANADSRLSWLEAQLTDLKQATVDCKADVDKQIACLKEELERRIGELETSNGRLVHENEIDEPIEGRTRQLLFDYQIDEISNFFKTNGHKCSENFTCCGISWRLAVQVTDKADLLGQSHKHLSCILAYFGDTQKIQCQTYFELRLLSQTPTRVHKVMTTHYTFSSLNGFGFPTLISEFELFHSDSGFVKNDTIKLQIYLRIEKLTRIINL